MLSSSNTTCSSNSSCCDTGLTDHITDTVHCRQTNGWWGLVRDSSDRCVPATTTTTKQSSDVVGTDAV